MRIITIKSCLSALLIGGLTACESATLIDLNKDFVTLMQQTEEAKQLHRSRVLDTTNFDSAIEGFRVAFADRPSPSAHSWVYALVASAHPRLLPQAGQTKPAGHWQEGRRVR